MQDNEQDKTITKTLWSETIIDALVVGLQKNVPDDKIRELIKEVTTKGFKSSYIIDKVTKELGAPARARVKRLLGK